MTDCSRRSPDLFATYGYDDASRLISITRGARVFTFGYDALSRRTSMSYPNGVATTYSYDDLSRLTEVKALLGETTVSISGYSYDILGNRTGKTHSEFSETCQYDPLDRLVDVNRVVNAH